MLRFMPIRAMIILVLLGVGCARPSARKAIKQQGLTGGVLVFSDDFNRTQLGPDWTTQRPNLWHIKNGKLFAEYAYHQGLWLKDRLPYNARIEFDSMAGSILGGARCDAYALVPEHLTGYVFVFGGWHNTMSIIGRMNESQSVFQELDNQNLNRVAVERGSEKGKVYHWTIVRIGPSLRWYVNGKLLLDFYDHAPLKGRYFGFDDWAEPVYYDNLKIYKL